jgi:hypothetical protein
MWVSCSPIAAFVLPPCSVGLAINLLETSNSMFAIRQATSAFQEDSKKKKIEGGIGLRFLWLSNAN